MLIRSQDKKTLINLRNIESIDIIGYKVEGTISTQDEENANTWYIAYSGCGKMLFIGQYSTEVKAIKVLDMIQEHYLEYYFVQGGQMATSSAVFQPFGFIPPKIFHMPTDEEVEV